MTKKLVLTAFVALMSTFIALAQTDPQPRPAASPTPTKIEKVDKNKSKEKSDKIEHAEKRSNGAAYSGRGKGGEKNTTEKGKLQKRRTKGTSQGKSTSDIKRKQGLEKKPKTDDQDENEVHPAGDNNPEAPRKIKNPKSTQPDQTGRTKPTDRPAAGKTKENDH